MKFDNCDIILAEAMRYDNKIIVTYREKTSPNARVGSADRS